MDRKKSITVKCSAFFMPKISKKNTMKGGFYFESKKL
jgi:hypothetical protein